MFTLTTNLAIWMAAVVDESVHQTHSYDSSHSNTSHHRFAPDRECSLQIDPGLGLLGLGLDACAPGQSVSLALPSEESLPSSRLHTGVGDS